MQFPKGSAPARPYLLELAQQVASGPADPAGCGRYEYVHVRQWTANTTVGRDGQGVSPIARTDYRRWSADDRSGRVITTSLEDPAAAATTRTDDFTAGQLPALFPGPLDTDPVALAATIDTVYPRARGAQSGIRAAADIYGWHIPNGGQRAAILEVLAGYDLLWRGTAVDRAGRAGVAVSADSGQGATRDLLILDPVSGGVLAYEQVALRNPGALPGPFPMVVTSTVFLDHHRQPRPG